MKKISLNGLQIRLLLKVSNSGYGFYSSVEEFLQLNQEIDDNEAVEKEIKKDELDDLLDMVTDYLCSDSLSEDDIPSEKETNELQNLLESL